MTENQERPKIVKQSVQQDEADSTRVSITFVVHSNDAGAARDYAASDQLIEHGIRVCEKVPLMQVGIAERGIPFFCDAEGNVLDLGFTAQDTSKPVDYHYSVTYGYIGMR